MLDNSIKIQLSRQSSRKKFSPLSRINSELAGVDPGRGHVLPPFIGLKVLDKRQLRMSHQYGGRLFEQAARWPLRGRFKQIRPFVAQELEVRGAHMELFSAYQQQRKL